MKFSIAMPVCNAARFLGEAVESVLAQTHADWELLCVDDGSTDGSGEILEGFAAKDPRIRVFRQTNRGVSAARNAALAAMRGDWFGFIDADDSIAPDALAVFAEIASSGAFDVIQADNAILPGQPGATTTPWRTPGIKAEASRHQGGHAPAIGRSRPGIKAEAVCAKDILLSADSRAWTIARYYSRKVFGALRFRDGMKLREDFVFWCDALSVEGARWGVIDFPFYRYRRHASSASRRAQDFHDKLDLVDAQIHGVETLLRLGGCAADMAQLARTNRFGAIAAGYVQLMRQLSKDEKAFFNVRIRRLEELLGFSPYPFLARLAMRGWPLRLAVKVFGHLAGGGT